MQLVYAVLVMIISCCYNVFILQHILMDAPKSPNLVSFMQVFFITSLGVCHTARFFTVAPQIPIKHYLKLSLTNFINIACQSIIMYIQVDISLQHLSRASTLIGTLLLGTFVYKKSYRTSKFISVALITFGIFTVFVASANNMYTRDAGINWDQAYWLYKVAAIMLLLLGMYSSALLGIQQEILFSKFGKCPSEALFYSHAFLLPLYVVLMQDIREQAAIFNKSEPVILFGSISIPKLWLLLATNVASQRVCTQTILFMTAEYTSLTVSLMMTLRKFISLIISLVHFESEFTSTQWVGTTFIFVGALLFVDEVFDKSQDYFWQAVQIASSRSQILHPSKSN